MAQDLTGLPADLPVPEDDGGADHLVGRRLPDVHLASTDGGRVAVAELAAGAGTRAVLYLYPRTGSASGETPAGWDAIPGARGCTPEACGFRDHHGDLRAAGAGQVFGLSSQDTDYQREAVHRLRLPFAMLSDPQLELAAALELPTFEAGGMRLYRRLTMVVRAQEIEHIFYPVFPSDAHAHEVVAWLRATAS